MPQITNLNVTPYYDDFDKENNFYKVLFRPGFPIQARELTTMQSILQNQVENVGTHFFKEGAMVIPGQVGYDTKLDAVSVQANFLGAELELYRNQLNNKIVTGLNSGVKAKILFSISAAESTKGYITFYVKYVESGGAENTVTRFENNEQLITDSDLTFQTTLIESGSPFAQLLPTNALSVGSAAYIQNGVYFIRGYFVDVPQQYIILDQYSNNPSYRIGLQVSESIVTSEDDESLNDNAAGTSNYSAPGAHRFKISTILVKKDLDDDADKNFIELLRINDSRIEKMVDRTAYNEIEKALALRTYDESGDYVLGNYGITVRDSLNRDDRPGINGVYEAGETTRSGNVASDELYTLEVSPGKSYVRGYQIETLSPTFVDFPKPRDTNALSNYIIPFTTGNLAPVNNVWGFPNLTGSGSVANPYQVLELYDTATATPGSVSGNLIGYARTLSIEYAGNLDSTFGDADDLWNLNIFDVQMLTIIQIGSAKTVTQGSVLVGASSRARAFVIENQTSATHLKVYQVQGKFRNNEEILLDGISIGTITRTHSYEYSDVRQVVSRDESTTTVEFTSDLILDDYLGLEGDTFTYTATGGSEQIVGFNSNFSSELRPGDIIYFSADKYVTVDLVTPTNLATASMSSIFNYATQTVLVTPGGGGAAPTAGTYTRLVRVRSRLLGQENNDLLSPMPKKYVKSISDETMTVRRTYDAISIPAGSFTVDLSNDEIFVAINNSNYTLSVLASTNGSYPVGSKIELKTGASNSGEVGYAFFTNETQTTLQVNNLTNVTSVKLTATIYKSLATKKQKTLNKMFILDVNKTVEKKDEQKYGLTQSFLYGTRIQDQELSLGLSDAYQLHAVYESLDDSAPVIPSLTIVESAFFAPGTFVTGKTSSAKAKVVAFESTILKVSIIPVNGTFIPGEQINGFDSSGVAISAIISDGEGSIEFGSKNVTADYYLELNQTGFFYNTSTIVRRPGVLAPTRKLTVIFDYLNHQSTGDYFAGQSYSNFDYFDIPFFNQNLALTDYLDFRPAVKNLYSGNGSITTRAYVNCSTLDFKSRVYTSGATVFDVPKIDSNFQCDFDYYLPRVDKLFLTSEGFFQIVQGKSSETPKPPEDIKNAMLLASLTCKPYGFDPERDVYVVKQDNRRYTMRDIGALDKRLSSVEYYTALSLLESQTANTKIVDATGKDRLKNGFIVDDFTSHDKSETNNQDYKISLDFANGSCRPSHYTTNVALEFNSSLSQHYVKVGPLLMLPFDEEKIVEQPYASRVVNVNPFNVFTYIGRIDLTPSTDDWIDTARIPARVVNIEGNFEATNRELGVDQNGFLPIQWNSWQTNWTGSSTLSTSVQYQPDWVASDVGKSPAPWVWDGRGMRRINETSTVAVTQQQSRTGTRSRIVPRVDRQSLGDSLISSTVVPWIRSRNVKMDVSRLKPRTRFYSFFDSKAFTNYITPKIIEIVKDVASDSRSNDLPFVVGETVRGLTSGVLMKVVAPNDGFKYNPYDDTEMRTTYSANYGYLTIDLDAMATQVNGSFFGNIQVGEVLVGQSSGARAVVKDRRLISDRYGNLSATFFIPSPNVDSNPRWGTGKRTIRLTTNDTDSRLEGAVASSAETIYEASGILNTVQENVLAVRNAEIVRDTVTEDRTIQSTRTEVRQIGWYDPLAQSFILDKPGGAFVTSFDVFFYTKDTRIPISCQIRTMENGYPTKRILPFSDVTLTPDLVQTSESALIPTKFTFRAPVYLQQSEEYCFVLLSDSNEYQVWVSRMGDIDVTKTRTISEQPYAGVLFKSQNASTWTADQYEDLKFTGYVAKFRTNGENKLVFNNAPLEVGNNGILNLRNNPVVTTKPTLEILLDPTTPAKSYTLGARVRQQETLAEATILSVTTLTGNGTKLVVDDVSGVFVASTETNSNISRRLVSSQTTATMVVSGAAADFIAGETITGNTSGATAEVVTWTSGTNTLTLRYVAPGLQQSFITGGSAETITASSSNAPGGADNTATIVSVAYVGDAVNSGALQVAKVTSNPVYSSEQKYVTISHSNHGMHDLSNNVLISGVKSEISDTTLVSAIGATDTTITLEDASQFHTIIDGKLVDINNPGYLKIENEIISYSAINPTTNVVTVKQRGVEGIATRAAHAAGVTVECYNLDGIPLVEINKLHTALKAVGSNGDPVVTLDSYRLQTTSVATDGITSGGDFVYATQNVPYEILTPQIQRLALPGTTISARINTVTGTSIEDGKGTISANNTQSFINDGVFEEIVLGESNEFVNQKLIASKVNETEELSGNKSLRIDVTLRTEKDYISPYIDTDRLSVITTSSRINTPSNPDEARKSSEDTHDAIYITKIASLINASGAIKIVFSAYRSGDATIKVLYRVRPVGSTVPIDQLEYEFFPDSLAQVPEVTGKYEFKDYEYEVNGLKFDQYQIKIVMTSPNQADVPILQDFRAIALAV